MKKLLSDQLLKVLGYNPDQIDFIPTASLKGDNVVKKSENMPWYKGPTLVEALDKFDEAYEELLSRGLVEK